MSSFGVSFEKAEILWAPQDRGDPCPERWCRHFYTEKLKSKIGSWLFPPAQEFLLFQRK